MDYYQTLRNDYIHREMYPQVGAVVARESSTNITIITVLVAFVFLIQSGWIVYFLP